MKKLRKLLTNHAVPFGICFTFGLATITLIFAISLMMPEKPHDNEYIGTDVVQEEQAAETEKEDDEIIGISEDDPIPSRDEESSGSEELPEATFGVDENTASVPKNQENNTLISEPQVPQIVATVSAPTITSHHHSSSNSNNSNNANNNTTNNDDDDNNNDDNNNNNGDNNENNHTHNYETVIEYEPCNNGKHITKNIHTCTVCGDSYTDTTTNECEFSDWEADKRSCKMCGYTESRIPTEELIVIDTSNWKFEKVEAVYDGQEHIAIVTGLPDYVTPVYVDNKRTNAGTNPAYVSFKVPEGYAVPDDMETTISISKAVINRIELDKTWMLTNLINGTINITKPSSVSRDVQCSYNVNGEDVGNSYTITDTGIYSVVATFSLSDDMAQNYELENTSSKAVYQVSPEFFSKPQYNFYIDELASVDGKKKVEIWFEYVDNNFTTSTTQWNIRYDTNVLKLISGTKGSSMNMGRQNEYIKGTPSSGYGYAMGNHYTWATLQELEFELLDPDATDIAINITNIIAVGSDFQQYSTNGTGIVLNQNLNLISVTLPTAHNASKTQVLKQKAAKFFADEIEAEVEVTEPSIEESETEAEVKDSKDSFDEVEAETNDLDTSTYETESEDNDINTSIDKGESEDNDLETSTDEVEAEDNNLETSTDEVESEDNNLEASIDEGESEDNDLETSTDEVEAEDNNLENSTDEVVSEDNNINASNDKNQAEVEDQENSIDETKVEGKDSENSSKEKETEVDAKTSSF